MEELGGGKKEKMEADKGEKEVKKRKTDNKPATIVVRLKTFLTPTGKHDRWPKRTTGGASSAPGPGLFSCFSDRPRERLTD